MTSSSPTTGEKGDVKDAIVSNAAHHPTPGHDTLESQGSTGVKRPGDRVFEILSVGSASLITIAIAAIGIFLLLRAFRALRNNAANFFTYSEGWNLGNTSEMYFGIPNLFAVTVAVSLVALVLGARRRRPPVAPLELTASERERVRRVLREHGVRPAVALVRALYPGEPTSAAVKTVRLIADRGDADGA